MNLFQQKMQEKHLNNYKETTLLIRSRNKKSGSALTDHTLKKSPHIVGGR